MNADGIDDLAVGASDDVVGSPPLGYAGRVYVYSGLSGQLLYSVTSPQPRSFGTFGHAIIGIEDLDGDGAGDFVVTTLFEGAAYIFSGATGVLFRTLVFPGETSCRFGEGLAMIPDVDHDGFDDIGVGATCEFGRGRLHLYSGRDGTFLRTLAPPLPIDGTRYFGQYVAGVPDADGDGAGDVLLGDPWANRPGPENTRGAAYLFSGASGELLHTLESPDRPFFFGEQVTGIPDVDGDGLGDVAISGDRHDTTLYQEGVVYMFSGQSGKLIGRIVSPREQQSGRFGSGLEGVSDVDGDGRGDLLVGAWGETPPGYPNRAGAAYLFSGATGDLRRTLVSPTPRMQGGGEGRFGAFLCALNDRSGPGLFSLGFGALDCASVCNPYPLGRAYIFRFCRADWNFDETVDSRDLFAFLTGFFNGAGDFNADGGTEASDFFDFIDAFFGGCGAK